MSSFLDELRWRNMLQDFTPAVEEKLDGGMCIGYIGFDPTARSLTIGNYVQIMILTLFQQAGHKPVILMGGATGRIGDPSGRDSERELQSYDVLDANLQHQVNQMRKLLDLDSDAPNAAALVNNLDFYHDMNALEFLRVVGKNLTVNYMLSKESVKNRMDKGISFTEFSYQLLQAYDFLCLYNEHECDIQMGGSDQWGNITSGIEFVRRNTDDGKAFGITTPLLTKADGTKFGKSQTGNIWLDPELTSPYQFYQFWINADDRDISKFLRFFSLKSHSEIEELEKQAETDPQGVKRVLAEELTVRVHSTADFKSALEVSQMIFNPKLKSDDLRTFSAEAMRMIADEVTSFDVPAAAISEGTDIISLMSEHTSICGSRGEARRAIQSNAVSVNKAKVTDIEQHIDDTSLLHQKYILLENGKKNKFVVRAV